MEENKHITIMTEQQDNALFQDACIIIDQAQKAAYRQINEILIKRNWLLGMRIQRDVLKAQRAEYGEQVIKSLANALTNPDLAKVYNQMRLQEIIAKAIQPPKINWMPYLLAAEDYANQ